MKLLKYLVNKLMVMETLWFKLLCMSYPMSCLLFFLFLDLYLTYVVVVVLVVRKKERKKDFLDYGLLLVQYLPN